MEIITGQKLKELRESKNLSKRELARRAGVSDAYIGLIEDEIRTNPSPRIMQKLYDALNYNPQTYKVKEVRVIYSTKEPLQDEFVFVAFRRLMCNVHSKLYFP